MEARLDISRRNLVVGTAAAGIALASAGLINTQHASAENLPTNDGLPNARPIDPVAVPDSWDDEADVVVVGLGGGGIAACAYAALNGATAIGIEKLPALGGNTEHGSAFVTYGGSRYQNEIEYAQPSYPFDADAVCNLLLPNHNFQIDYHLMRTLAVKGAECVDWMGDCGVPWALKAPIAHVDESIAGFVTAPLGMQPIVRRMWDVAVDNGARGMMSSECVALVQDSSGRVVGVQVIDADDNTVFIHANKAVILTAGGFSCNFDMMAEFAPTALKVVSNYGLPTDTGECIRMGLGVGADISGFNSFTCFDGGIAAYEDGVGEFVHYLYSGDNQLSRQPWLGINKFGDRYTYQSTSSGLYALPWQGSTEVAQPGGRGYVIFDSDYETNIDAFGQTGCRKPITGDASCDAERMAGLAPLDWREGVADALDRGAIKKADTLEELAEMLGLDAEVVVGAVERWNEMCANGEDTDMHFPTEWLIPVEKAPFYGIKIGGQIIGTHAGLRVNNGMQVIDTDGKVIPGLYAGFHTAGGAMGENMCYATVLGNCGLSWTGGYIAAQTVIEKE